MRKIGSLKERLSRALGALVIGGALTLAAPAVAPASIVVPMTIEELGAVSHDVVRVKVQARASEWHNGLIITRHTLLVEDTYKGQQPTGETIELVLPGGEIGKIGQMSPGLPTLNEGEEAILFLSEPPASSMRGGNEHLNLESPLVQSPQIVGGYQGKFQIVREVIETPVGNTTVTQERVRVRRDNPGRAISNANAPLLEEFGRDLRNVVDSGRQISPVEEREIVTVGKVSVPRENPQHRALRLFDPPARREGPARAGVKPAALKGGEQAAASAAPSQPASNQPVNP